jgi:Rrf2 family cysteine metabolism transcriptional repressor
MFRVSKAEEQAVRLIMRMALVARQMTLGELAAVEDLPEPTVAKLLGMLRRHGVVEAVRGRNGGYVLAGRPSEISAGQVIGAVSNDSVFGYPCQDDDAPPDCPRTENCGLRPVWRHLESRVAEVLRQTTIADLLQREATSAENLQDLWPLDRR